LSAAERFGDDTKCLEVCCAQSGQTGLSAGSDCCGCQDIKEQGEELRNITQKLQPATLTTELNVNLNPALHYNELQQQTEI